MKNDINMIQDDIIKEFSQFDEWFDTYEYLIDMGNTLKSSDTHLKVEQYAIGGCQSVVWLKAELQQDSIVFSADSDSKIVKGMLSLLLRVLNNQTPEDIDQADLYFIDEIGLQSHLSPSRRNGLSSIIKEMKSYAKKYSSSRTTK